MSHKVADLLDARSQYLTVDTTMGGVSYDKSGRFMKKGRGSRESGGLSLAHFLRQSSLERRKTPSCKIGHITYLHYWSICEEGKTDLLTCFG